MCVRVCVGYTQNTYSVIGCFDKLLLKSKQILGLIDFNGMSTCLGLFNTYRLGNCIHCTFILHFLYDFLHFLHSVMISDIPNSTNLQTNLFNSLDETLTGTTTPDQGRPESNCNEEVVYTT